MNRLYSDASKPKTTAEMFAEVWAAIGQMQTARTAEATSVGANGLRFHSGGGATFDDGGEVTINGGSLRVTSADGTKGLVYFGDSDSGTRLWQFSFPDGDVAFGLLNGSEPGFWGGVDHSGNLLIANDAGSGSGLSRPYFSMRVVPSPVSMWPTSTATTSGTAIKLWQGVNVVENPRIVVGVNKVQNAGVSHWRMDIDGTTVIADETGIGSFTVDIPDWGVDGGINPGDAVGIDLYGWVTGGGTSMQLNCDRLHGTQS